MVLKFENEQQRLRSIEVYVHKLQDERAIWHILTSLTFF